MRLIAKLKWGVIYLIGMVIYHLPMSRNYRTTLLSFWAESNKIEHWMDRFCYIAVSAYFMRFVYLTEKDPDRRESLKSLVMGGDSGQKWAEHYDAIPIDSNFIGQVGGLSYEKACPLLPELNRFLSDANARMCVIQIGSSSGREIAWLAKRHSIHSFVGTDIYSEVVDYATRKYEYSNLSFEICSAKEVHALLARYDREEVVIFASGSLQYVQPEHLTA